MVVFQVWIVVEFVCSIVFTIEYILKFYAVTIDPIYKSGQSSLWSYFTGFLPMVDLLGFLPYWIVLFGGFGQSGMIVDTTGPSDIGGTFVKALRLLRIFRFERYTHAFMSKFGILYLSLICDPVRGSFQSSSFRFQAMYDL